MCIGPVLPEPGDRTIDDPGIDRSNAGIVEPVFGQAARLEILHQHVGLGRKLADQRRTFWAGNVDRGRALVTVGAKVIGAFAGIVRAIGQLEERRSPAAGIITLARLFDLEHLGAKVGEDLG